MVPRRGSPSFRKDRTCCRWLRRSCLSGGNTCALSGHNPPALRIPTGCNTIKFRNTTSHTERRGDTMADGEKVLLIEDDREIATTLRSVLEAAGYDVSYASNGKEGQRLIEE